MHYLIFIMAFGLIYAQPFSKEIIIPSVKKPSLMRVKLDQDIYRHTQQNYGDVRILSSNKQEIGYFITKVYPTTIIHQKKLKATTYKRETQTLIYTFKKPFLVEEIILDIKNRNFSTFVSVEIDGKKVIKDYNMFDYSYETGNQNFSVKLPSTKAKKVTITYNLKKTKFFSIYKYSFKKAPRPLRITSATFINREIPKITYDKTIIPLLEVNETKRVTHYLFKTNHLDIDHFRVNTMDKNYKREGSIYLSGDKKKWKYLRYFHIQNSTFTKLKVSNIKLKERKKYIKLSMVKKNNIPLKIESIEAFIHPNYLYFIADANQSYTLKFGGEYQTKPLYDLVMIVKKDTPFQEAVLSSLTEKKVEVKARDFFEVYKNILFTIGMLFAVGVLLYIALVLLKKEEA